MSLILPKGILVNSPGIENRIESINQEPLEPKDIARFWKGSLITAQLPKNRADSNIFS